MGLFLEIAIIRGRGSFPVKKYLKNIAGSSNFKIVPEECIISTGPKGSAVKFNEDVCGHKELAAALSKEAKSAVLLCYIYDDDFWGYYLYDNGIRKDVFCPIPDYFGDISEEEALKMAGNAEILSEVFDVPAAKTSQYLLFWEELKDRPGEKAYKDDIYGYSVWQIKDFIKAFGFSITLFPGGAYTEDNKPVTEKKDNILTTDLPDSAVTEKENNILKADLPDLAATEKEVNIFKADLPDSAATGKEINIFKADLPDSAVTGKEVNIFTTNLPDSAVTEKEDITGHSNSAENASIQDNATEYLPALQQKTIIPQSTENTVKKELEEKKYHFQVNLGGMLDILSNHLYKSPDVFIRELLQNGVDAITMRQKKQPGWNGGIITINVVPGKSIQFSDNGSGLNEEEIHRFLAVIGQSSKTQLVNGQIPEDYIGRFGIGLLSCFMVSDSIVVHTIPSDGSQAHIWTGFPDGTYTLEPLNIDYNMYKADMAFGTTVILKAKKGEEHYFHKEKIAELARYYGLALPVPVYMSGNPEKLNNVPSDFSGIGRSQLLSFGNWLFNEEFLDAIPIQTPHLSGVAYILSYRTDSSVKSGHRIYLKQMLLTEEGNTLLPSWAFFMRCFLNTRNLRPTASREDFYEDDALLEARKEFENAISDYLGNMAHNGEEFLLESIVNTHVQAIKSMAVWDDRLFKLFIDYLPFETSEGTRTGQFLKQAGVAEWIGSVPRFKQLRPVFMAQGRLLICTGYTNDEELVRKLANMYSLPLEPFQEDSMDLVMEELYPFEYQRIELLETVASQALSQFDCKASVRRFLPMDLPVLYSISDEVQFLRQLQSAKESSHNIFSDALSSLINSVEEKPLALLYLNLNSPLIQRLSQINDEEMLKSISSVLYVQALLAGGHPLRGGELKVLNKELLNLIEYSL